jgi:hypothetical protein
MRNFHVVLADNIERNVHAAMMTILPNGVLEFRNDLDGQMGLVCAYASGSWVLVEVERLDDKG